MFKLKRKAQKRSVCRIIVDSDMLPIVIPSSRHDAKPFVGCSLIMSTQTGLNKKDTFEIAMSMSSKLNGLTVKQANSVIEWLQLSVSGFVNKQSFVNTYFSEMEEKIKSPKMSLNDLKL